MVGETMRGHEDIDGIMEMFIDSSDGLDGAKQHKQHTPFFLQRHNP